MKIGGLRCSGRMSYCCPCRGSNFVGDPCCSFGWDEGTGLLRWTGSSNCLHHGKSCHAERETLRRFSAVAPDLGPGRPYPSGYRHLVGEKTWLAALVEGKPWRRGLNQHFANWLTAWIWAQDEEVSRLEGRFQSVGP